MTPLGEDLRHVMGHWGCSRRGLVFSTIVRAPLYPQVRAVVWMRVSMWFWSHGLRPIALWCKSRSVASTGAEVHPGATIGPGLNMVHTVGVVIGHEVVAGRDLVLHHGVTLGHGGRADGQPRLGDGIRIGAGAVVLGPVTVGDRARIGANAVILADVASGQTAVGVWKGQHACSDVDG